MILAALVLAVETAPRQPRPEVSAYLVCVLTHAQRRSSSTETPEAIANAAVFECRQGLPAAARELDQSSIQFMKSHGWTLPVGAQTGGADLEPQVQAEAQDEAIAAVNEARHVPKLVFNGPPANHDEKRSHSRPVERYRLTQSGGGLGNYVQETAVFSARPGNRGDWFVERHRTDDNWCGHRENNTCEATTVSHHQWIASRSCPALHEVMTQLPVAQRAERAIQREEARKHKYHVVVDTPLLTLETVAEGRGATVKQSDWLGPINDWWWHAQDSLKSCWTGYPA